MRESGILLPISSLPSQYGIGCFSKEAYEFVDQLALANQKYWQILPLGPTSYGDSPYQSFSTYAGNPYFIDLNTLIEEGVLTKKECNLADFGSDSRFIDYGKLYKARYKLLRKAYERSNISQNPEFQTFQEENAWWLDDYSLFMAVKGFFQDECWDKWPEDIKKRYGYALDYYREQLYFEVEFQKYMQFEFSIQWKKLKTYANENGIRIIGDIPIYVAYDSADTWAHPELFQLDEENVPLAVAGCPPDGFAADGQLWGNPLYRWDYHRQTGYAWWMQRLSYAFYLYDVVRIDHFRGFDEYYAIPYGETTAQKGKWEKGPGMDLFNTLNKKIENLRVIAEDLGFLTKSVLEMLKESGYPGMKVLQFAFDGSENSSYLPYKYEHNCVVYTGTHDNETTKGWLENLQGHDRDFVREYINCYEVPVNDCVWALIRTALASVADLAIIPIQDYLCLGNEARMNVPATLGDNWKWRLTKGQISDMALYHMREVTRIYGRLYREPVVETEEETEADEKEELNNSVKDDKIKK